MQVLWQVDEEAALVAVQPPLGGTQGVQHQGPGVAFWAGSDTLSQEAVLAANVGAHGAGHASLVGSRAILQQA